MSHVQGLVTLFFVFTFLFTAAQQEQVLLFYTYDPKAKNKDSWPFEERFYLLLNLVIGVNFGGPEIDNSIFPHEFITDYIKVYKN